MAKAKRRRKPDVYDKAIAFLRKHPERIYRAWVDPTREPGGALFSFTSRSRKAELSRETHPIYGDRMSCGCLTQIRGGDYAAPTKALTAAIRDDERIPAISTLIDVESLPVFAEWQRRLDKELGRKPL